MYISILASFFSFLLFSITLLFSSYTSSVSADILRDVLEDAGVSAQEQKAPLPKLDNKDTSEEKINWVVYDFIRILLIISGVVAVTFIVIGGVEYTLSAGADDRLNGAKAKIQYALMGLILVIFSYTILANVINFLEIPE